MSERYIDPNSGAAPQPGGVVTGVQSFEAEQEAPEQEAAVAGAEEQNEQQDEKVEAEAPDEAPDDEEVDDENDYEGIEDPSKHTVKDVLAYVEEHPEERERLITQEEAGKQRPQLLKGLKQEE